MLTAFWEIPWVTATSAPIFLGQMVFCDSCQIYQDLLSLEKDSSKSRKSPRERGNVTGLSLTAELFDSLPAGPSCACLFLSICSGEALWKIQDCSRWIGSNFLHRVYCTFPPWPCDMLFRHSSQLLFSPVLLFSTIFSPNKNYSEVSSSLQLVCAIYYIHNHNRFSLWASIVIWASVSIALFKSLGHHMSYSVSCFHNKILETEYFVKRFPFFFLFLYSSLIYYNLTAVSPLSSQTFSPFLFPTPFPFRKGQASQGYQLNTINK